MSCVTLFLLTFAEPLCKILERTFREPGERRLLTNWAAGSLVVRTNLRAQGRRPGADEIWWRRGQRSQHLHTLHLVPSHLTMSRTSQRIPASLLGQFASASIC